MSIQKVLNPHEIKKHKKIRNQFENLSNSNTSLFSFIEMNSFYWAWFFLPTSILLLRIHYRIQNQFK